MGQLLGAVGGRVVAEVLLGILRTDKHSWVNIDPEWRPEAIVPDIDGDGVIGMPDLIAFVG